MTYQEMLQRAANVMGKRRLMLKAPLVSPGLSKAWIALITGGSMDLIAPLVESLRHRMVVNDNIVQRAIAPSLVGFDSAVRESIEGGGEPVANPRSVLMQAEQRAMKAARTVRSVQRLPMPKGRDAHWVAREYMRWLPGQT